MTAEAIGPRTRLSATRKRAALAEKQECERIRTIAADALRTRRAVSVRDFSEMTGVAAVALGFACRRARIRIDKPGKHLPSYIVEVLP